MNNGYRGSEIITTYSDVKRRVHWFNNKAREVSVNLRVRLTGDSEEYAYYAELILPNKSKIPFLIRPDYGWGMYGRTDFSKEATEWYYQAWYLWKS
jgi:hypothetical protein